MAKNRRLIVILLPLAFLFGAGPLVLGSDMSWRYDSLWPPQPEDQVWVYTGLPEHYTFFDSKMLGELEFDKFVYFFWFRLDDKSLGDFVAVERTWRFDWKSGCLGADSEVSLAGFAPLHEQGVTLEEALDCLVQLDFNAPPFFPRRGGGGDHAVGVLTRRGDRIHALHWEGPSREEPDEDFRFSDEAHLAWLLFKAMESMATSLEGDWNYVAQSDSRHAGTYKSWPAVGVHLLKKGENDGDE